MEARDFGIGVVLGNTFDCWNHRAEDINTRIMPGDDWETGWGNKRITQEVIHGLRNMGFKTVKLSVTWIEHFNKINSEWSMAEWFIRRVKEVAGLVMDEGMYCIINVHHDTDWITLANEEYIKDRYYNLWRSIAEYFNGYRTDRLSFEAFNGVGETKRKNKDVRGLPNLLNSLFHDAVRQTEGNDDRLLLYEGYYSEAEASCKNSVFPKDRNTMVAVHFETPWEFAAQKQEEYPGIYHNMFNKCQVAGALSWLGRLKECFGMDIVVSELHFNMNQRSPEKALDWFSVIFRYCREHNIPMMLWDNGYTKESVLDRENQRFLLPKLDKLVEYYYNR